MKKFFAAFMVVAFALTGCSSAQQTKIDAIKSAKKIVMYTNAEFPPYEFMENNEIVGVDVEIGKAIAEKIGVELEISNAAFDGIVASIGSGKGDIAISGITINDERKESVDFSVPYVDSVQYIIIKDDAGEPFVEDFADKVLGGQLGTTGAMLIEDEISEGVLAGTKTDLRTYPSAPGAMQDLISGRIDAVVIDELVAISIAEQNPGYKAIPFKYKSGTPVTEQFGVAIQKGNQELLDIINEVVSEMVNSGKIDAAIEKYSE